jgi:hypothetical protein
VFDSAADDDVSDEDGGRPADHRGSASPGRRRLAATSVGDPEFGAGEHNRPGGGRMPVLPASAGRLGVRFPSGWRRRRGSRRYPFRATGAARSVVPPTAGEPGRCGAVGAADARTEDDDRAGRTRRRPIRPPGTVVRRVRTLRPPPVRPVRPLRATATLVRATATLVRATADGRQRVAGGA